MHISLVIVKVCFVADSVRTAVILESTSKWKNLQFRKGI